MLSRIGGFSCPRILGSRPPTRNVFFFRFCRNGIPISGRYRNSVRKVRGGRVPVPYAVLPACLPVYFRFRWTPGPHDVQNARSGPIPGKESGAFAGSQRIRKKRRKSLSDPVFRFFPILRFFAVRPVFPKMRLSEAAMRFAARSAPFGIPEFVRICILSRKRTLLFHYLCVFRTAERRFRTGRRNEKEQNEIKVTDIFFQQRLLLFDIL